MTEMFASPSQICCLYIFLAGMDQFDRDSTIADFKNGVTNLMVRESRQTALVVERLDQKPEGYGFNSYWECSDCFFQAVCLTD